MSHENSAVYIQVSERQGHTRISHLHFTPNQSGVVRALSVVAYVYVDAAVLRIRGSITAYEQLRSTALALQCGVVPEAPPFAAGGGAAPYCHLRLIFGSPCLCFLVFGVFHDGFVSQGTALVFYLPHDKERYRLRYCSLYKQSNVIPWETLFLEESVAKC